MVLRANIRAAAPSRNTRLRRPVSRATLIARGIAHGDALQTAHQRGKTRAIAASRA
jgi:hypothetical protein